MTISERLVNRLVTLGERRTSRRRFLTAATVTGAALAVDPVGFLTRPQSAYATVCGPGASCGDGWSAMCCSINGGRNTCPPHTFRGGWWKADRSSFCGGHARYYIDCNALPHATFHCHCNQSNCDHRYVACNIFRYGQCNTQIRQTTAVVCREISCIPPWQLYPGTCSSSSRTDNNTAQQNAPCLIPVTFAPAPAVLRDGQRLNAGDRLVSENRHTELRMQKDGNLVLRNQSGIIWATRTANVAAGGHALMASTGRLLVFDAHHHVKWRSHNDRTTRRTHLRLRNNGQLAIYRGTRIIWHTYTHTP